MCQLRMLPNRDYDRLEEFLLVLRGFAQRLSQLHLDKVLHIGINGSMNDLVENKRHSRHHSLETWRNETQVVGDLWTYSKSLKIIKRLLIINL